MEQGSNYVAHFNHGNWMHVPAQFDLRQPADLVRWAQPLENLRLNYLDTIIVADVQTTGSNVRSVVFDAQRGLLSTPRTTRQLIKMLGKQLPYGHQLVTARHAEQLGESHTKLPIIMSNLQLIPLGGTTRGTTSWIAGHHLTGWGVREHQTVLHFCNQLHLTVTNSCRRFGEQVAKADRLQSRLASEPPSAQGEWLCTALLDYTLAQMGVDYTLEDVHFHRDRFFGKL